MRSSKFTRLAAVAGAVTAALALGACGPTVSNSDEPASDDKGTDTADYSDVEPADEIAFWSNHPGGSIKLENEMAADFEKETGIKVNIVTAGASYPEVAQKFQTAQISGDMGDLVVLSDATWFQAFLSDSIAPVDEIFKSADLSTDGYHDALYEDYLYEGQHYAVPYARSTPIYFFNKDHYAAAGLPGEGPKTWEEAREFSMKLHETDPSTMAFGYPAENYYPAWTMSNLVWSYGGTWSDGWDFSTLTDENTKEALEFAQASVNDGWAGVLSNDPPTDFGAGAVSQIVGSTGTLGGVLEAATFDVGVAFLPTGPADTDKVVPTGGAGIAIASKASPERQKAAAMFAAYLTNPENTARFSEFTGYLPVQKDADMTAVYEQTPLLEVAVDQLERARPQAFARVFLPGGDLAIGKALVSILTNDADIPATMESLEGELQGLYDRDLKSVLE